MSISSIRPFGSLSDLLSSLPSAVSKNGSGAESLRALQDAQKAQIKETILSTPSVDQLITSNPERYYRELDRQNVDYLSKRDPNSLLFYTLVRDTAPHRKDSQLDLIDSVHGTRDTGLVLESQPDPRIEKIVEAYKKAGDTPT